MDLLFDEEQDQVFTSDSKVHIDFLCAGFAKCGTTSLHYALAQNPKIFLPRVKETYFLCNMINRETHEMFDQWAMKYRFREQYTDYIKTYLECYPLEQIKVIVSEELYADIHGHMDDLRDFLGIPEEDKLDYQDFSRENVGSKVARDPKGLEINMRLEELRHNLTRKSDFQALDILNEIRKQIEEITLVDYSESMLDSTRKNLLEYYMDSIYEMENLIGRSLQSIWY